MTIIVTRNVADRFRGFLASCMCEIAPGVYSAPRMNARIRERVWKVLEDWFYASTNDNTEQSILMTWPDTASPGGQAFRSLGIPTHDLHDHHGVFLARRALNDSALGLNAGSSEKYNGNEHSNKSNNGYQ